MLHHVDHGGRGPALLLLHAFPLSSRMWERLVPLLSDRWRVVAVDLPGLGRSPVPSAAPSMDEVAEEVLEVLDHLGVASTTVLGISTGGYVALTLAGRARDRVDGLALGSTTTRLVAPDDPDERRRTAAEVERSGRTDAVAGSADEGLGTTAHREQPQLRDLLASVIAASDPAGVAWMARAIAARPDTGETLQGFDGRVLLLFGAEDSATPPERGAEMAQLRTGRADDTTYVVLSAVGHLTALEAPEAVAECLEEVRPR